MRMDANGQMKALQWREGHFSKVTSATWPSHQDSGLQECYLCACRFREPYTCKRFEHDIRPGFLRSIRGPNNTVELVYALERTTIIYHNEAICLVTVYHHILQPTTFDFVDSVIQLTFCSSMSKQRVKHAAVDGPTQKEVQHVFS
jgi:hypothetical protein